MFNKFLVPAVFFAIPCTALASTVNINSSESGEHDRSLHGIRADTVTRGTDLTGMVVTATYLDGTSESSIWNKTRGAWGQADGSDFDLIFGWSEFELSVSKSLVSLSMDAASGNAVFDIGKSTRDGEDTYGTKGGYSLYIFGDDPAGEIDVIYSRGFAIAGHKRALDTYTLMTIDFSGLEGGGVSGDIMFRTDLDSLEVAGDLTPVPLPASMLMFASAFGLLGAQRLRKKT